MRFGISDFERFDAIDGGYKGFNMSVHGALKDESELLLLEDDCLFTGTINDLLAAKAQLPNDWDLLYLGANIKAPMNRYSERLNYLTDAWTSHAILYSNKGADWCFKNFDPKGELIYDEWLRAVVQKMLKVFITNPMLALQAPGFSDIWGKDTNYGLKETERYLQ